MAFRARKAIAKSRTLRLQSCFIQIFLIRREVPFTQEVSGAYTSPFLDTDGLKMALRARKVSGAFEKQAPGPKTELFKHYLKTPAFRFIVEENILKMDLFEYDDVSIIM